MHGRFFALWEFTVTNSQEWLSQAHSALDVLRACEGFIESHIMRSPDEPLSFVVHTTWRDVGSYRRALGSSESKMVVWPFLAEMQDRPTAYEELVVATLDGITQFDSSVAEG